MTGSGGGGRYQRAAQEASGIPHSSERPEVDDGPIYPDPHGVSAPAEKAVEKPALPCPPWCESSHARGTTSHQQHRHVDDHSIGVTLYLCDYGADSPELDYFNGRLYIYVGAPGSAERSIMKPLSEAAELIEMAVAFGRDDVAALIRELAALASELSTDGSLPSVYSSPGLSHG